MRIILKINSRKTDNYEKLSKQIKKVSNYLKDRYFFNEISSIKTGTVNDDFLREKFTLIITFE